MALQYTAKPENLVLALDSEIDVGPDFDHGNGRLSGVEAVCNLHPSILD